MKKTTLHQDPRVLTKFATYPKEVQPKMEALRDLILEAASEIEHISEIEETLKWGEPSYLVKKGSTIRMDWKPRSPDQYAIYFSCSTSLVETFKIVHGDTFRYEKNRAILFDLDDKVPQKELKACFKMALRYHLLKGQPLLGG